MTESNSDGSDNTSQMAMLPWFPRDFDSATKGWPLTARGIYRELLDAQWDMGALPNDEVVLRRIVGATSAQWREAWPLVKAKFPQDSDGMLRNPRLEQHRTRSIAIRRKRQAASKKANASRWGHLRPIDGGRNER